MANGPRDALHVSAAELREEFDSSFARKPSAASEEHIGCLLIEVAKARYALRVLQLDALHAGRTIVPVASPDAALRGLAAFRGGVVPVYDLASLLGQTRPRAPRWVFTTGRNTPVAFAFDGFIGHHQAPVSDLTRASTGHSPFIAGLLRYGAEGFPLIQVPALVEAIAKRVAARANAQEGDTQA